MSSTTSTALSAQTLEGNRLLALLDPDTRRRMLPAFKLVSFDMSHTVYQPDRAITHIYFPLTTVTSVLSEMKDDPQLRAIPVVMLTTSHRDADILSAYSGGACSFVSKPVNFDRLKLMAGHFVRYWSTVARIPKVEG